MKSKLRRNSLIIACLGAVLGCLLQVRGTFLNFENKSLDYRFRLRGAQKSDSPVVIAAIDDEALQTIGKWPWPRKIHGRFLDVCRKAGAKAVAFDVVFYEPDRYQPSNDTALESAIKRNGLVISAFDFTTSDEQIIQQDKSGRSLSKTLTSVRKEVPIDNVFPSRALGFVNAWPDPDGYLRRASLSYKFENTDFYSLNLEAVSVFLDQPEEEILKDLPAWNSQVWDNNSKEVLINWRGPQEDTFPTYSCAKILDPSVPNEWITSWLKDKIVLIGSTALGLYDHYPIPFSSAFPGLYYHANIIDNILSKGFLKPVPGWFTVLLILLFAVGMGFLVPRAHIWIGMVSMLVLLGLFWFLGYILMVKKLVYIELVSPTIALAGNYLAVFFYRFIIEQKEKAGIKRAFGVYVNPHVVDQIAKNPDGLKLGGELREMTVMFSDVAGFTSVSEKLTPQELVHLLNLYLTAMTDTIMKYDGTVDKYEGDAIMAFWGAPLVEPNHAKKACLAVLENRQRLKELNENLEKQGLHNLSARCGLNTGPMNVGNMGSTQKFNYTVMGDAVNLASRLEGANKQYSTGLMIAESTYEQSKDAVEARELDLLRVKGKKLPIKVFELVAKKGELTDSQKKGFDAYNEGLSLYRKRDFKEAIKKFQSVQEFLDGDGPSKTYLQRAKDYVENPPPEDWDGVFTMTTK